MTTPPDDGSEAVALFRYGLIAESLVLPPVDAATELRRQAAKSHVIPGSQRTRVAVQTMRDWVRRYRKHGFDGLVPKQRSDRARPRRLPPEAVEVLLSIKTAAPGLRG